MELIKTIVLSDYRNRKQKSYIKIEMCLGMTLGSLFILALPMFF
ncbi:MAG: hypothetical protein RR620_08830 [Clostridium sp.]